MRRTTKTHDDGRDVDAKSSILAGSRHDGGGREIWNAGIVDLSCLRQIPQAPNRAVWVYLCHQNIR